MERSANAYLLDALEAAQSILRFTDGLDEDGYVSNELVRAAVERRFEIIGEALNQLARLAPDAAEIIPQLARIIAFRNLLIHGYASIDDRRVWRVREMNLPDLIASLERLAADRGVETRGAS